MHSSLPLAQSSEPTAHSSSAYDTYGDAQIYEWPAGDFDRNYLTSLTDRIFLMGRPSYDTGSATDEPWLDMDGNGVLDIVDRDLVIYVFAQPARPSSSVGNPYLFTGRPTHTLASFTHPTTGKTEHRRIQDNRNRVYDPKHGRWLQRDPGPGAAVVFDSANGGPKIFGTSPPQQMEKPSSPASVAQLLGRYQGMGAITPNGASVHAYVAPRKSLVGLTGLNGQYQDGMNLYQYVGSRSTVLTDPSGLSPTPMSFKVCCRYKTETTSWGGFTSHFKSRKWEKTETDCFLRDPVCACKQAGKSSGVISHSETTLLKATRGPCCACRVEVRRLVTTTWPIIGNYPNHEIMLVKCSNGTKWVFGHPEGYSPYNENAAFPFGYSDLVSSRIVSCDTASSLQSKARSLNDAEYGLWQDCYWGIREAMNIDDWVQGDASALTAGNDDNGCK